MKKIVVDELYEMAMTEDRGADPVSFKELRMLLREREALIQAIDLTMKALLAEDLARSYCKKILTSVLALVEQPEEVKESPLPRQNEGSP